MVEELTRSLVLIVDRAALEASIAARVRELFDPDRLLILQPNPQGDRFASTFSFGLAGVDPETVELEGKGTLARWLLVNEACLVLSRNRGAYEYLSQEDRAVIDILKADVYVPLICLNRLTGIVALGSDDPEWRLTKSDLALLALLGHQAGLAFENAALYREEQKRLDRLYRAQRLAAVGQLAATVAHEVRNPLTAIRSTMQYVLRGLDAGDPKHGLIDELLGEVDRIDGTISGLLSLTRSGDFQPAEIDAAEPLRQALRLIWAQAEEKGIEIEESWGHGSFPVLGDAGQLRQVFVNLLLNALQATSQGGRVTTRISLWRPQERQRWVQIQITDDGPGIAAEERRQIFEPFFTTKKSGTGLGLAICKGILERHEGEIDLESEVGKGTRVYVRLPLPRGGDG